MGRLIRILAIDGGGIRGILPAMVMAEIERRTGKRVAELFDFMAGTSTGGILALAASIPAPASAPAPSPSPVPPRPLRTAIDLIGLYEKEGPQIFACSLVHKIAALGNLRLAKFDPIGIEEVLQRYFGETRLKDALVDVMVTAYDIEARQPFFFKSWRAKVRADYDFPACMVARATSAAPTYFPPARLPSAGPASGPNDYFALVDGGVAVNNPSLSAYAEARILHGEADDFLVVSLGTGDHAAPIPYQHASRWGLAAWAQPLFGITLDAPAVVVDYQMRELLPSRSGVPRFFRFQANLGQISDEIDNPGSEMIHSLKVVGGEMIASNDALLDTVCALLTA